MPSELSLAATVVTTSELVQGSMRGPVGLYNTLVSEDSILWEFHWVGTSQAAPHVTWVLSTGFLRQPGLAHHMVSGVPLWELPRITFAGQSQPQVHQVLRVGE